MPEKITNRTIIVLLNSLDKARWKRFKLFMKSEYFRHNKRAQQLVAYLASFHPPFPTSKTSDSHLFAASYPEVVLKRSTLQNQAILSAQEDKKLRDVLSMLQLSFNQFIGVETYLSTEEEQAYMHRMGLSSMVHQAEPSYKTTLKAQIGKLLQRTHKLLDAPERMDSDTELHRYLLTLFEFHQFRGMSDLEGKNTFKKEVGELLLSLDRYFLPTKFRFLSLALQRSLSGRALPFKRSFLEETYLYYCSYDFPSILAEVMFHLFATLWAIAEGHQSRQTQHVSISKRLRKSLLTAYQEVSTQPTNHVKDADSLRLELQSIFDYSFSIEKRRADFGSLAATVDLFMFYKQWLEAGVLLTNEQLNHKHYKNIITLALNLGFIEYANEVQDTYATNLIAGGVPGVHKDLLYIAAQYNKAHISIHEGTSEVKLTQLVPKMKIYQLGVEMMVLKQYVLDALHDRIDENEVFYFMEGFNKACKSFDDQFKKEGLFYGNSRTTAYKAYIKYTRHIFYAATGQHVRGYTQPLPSLWAEIEQTKPQEGAWLLSLIDPIRFEKEVNHALDSFG